MIFTKEQQEAARNLLQAQHEWLQAYGWKLEKGGRVSHRFQPKAQPSYTVGDAMAMTRAEPLRYADTRAQGARG